MRSGYRQWMTLIVAALMSCTAIATEKIIGMAFPSATHGWMGAIIKNAEDEAQTQKVRYVMTTSADANQQTRDIEALIAKKVSAVVMLPIEIDAMASIAQKLKSANIPLILVDREVNTTDFTALIKGDNLGIGINAARYIGGALKGRGNVVEIIGVPASVTTQRAQGFRQELTKLYPDIKIVDSQAGDFQRDKSKAVMQGILRTQPKIDAVYTHDDEMALGVLQAIKDAKRTDIKIVTGAGGSRLVYQLIAKGDPLMKATFVYSPLMVKDAVKLAVDHLDGKASKNKVVVIPATTVHMGNISRLYDSKANY
jgi:ribose transport system substrate-binding protein